MNKKYRFYTAVIAAFLFFVLIEKISTTFPFIPKTNTVGWTKSTKPLTPFSVSKTANINEILLYPTVDMYLIRKTSKTPCHLYKICNNPNQTKYFHESKYDNHADVRFFNYRLTVPQARIQILGLIKAWSEFSADNDIISWISHGTLLSWYWNKKLFPWDNDLDFQMTFNDLVQLTKKFNQTLVADRYLLDINPNFYYRQHQLSNVIDARFIDTKSGMYIDITALSSNSTNVHQRVICCKSPHCYSHNQLFPLRKITMEGFEFYGPNNVEKILKEEYGENSITDTEYNGYKFDGKRWVSKYELRKQEMARWPYERDY